MVDELDIEGFETGVGTSYINKGNPAKEDAHLVALLRSHGAIIIGKSTMHEIGKPFIAFHGEQIKVLSIDRELACVFCRRSGI